jgi:cardiolipin synthase
MSLSQELKSIPNMLSILRLLLVPVFLTLLVNDLFILALIVLAFASFTDWLDGQIARHFNQETALGKMLDPAADRLFIFATLIGLTLNGNIPAWLAVVIVMRDVLVLIGLPVLRKLGYGALPVHFLGKAGTFALLYALPLMLMADIWPQAEFIVLPLAWSFAWWGVALYWLSGFIYLNQLRELLSQQRRKSSSI